MSFSKKEIENILFERLIRSINPDFKLNKLKSQFILDKEDCRNIFSLVIIKRSGGYVLEPNIYIQIKEVEYIYQLITKLDSANFNDSITIGGTLGNLLGNPSGELVQIESLTFPLFEMSDIEIAINEIVQLFNNFCLKYFEKNSNLNTVNKLLNENPEKRTVHMILNPERCTKGLIAAYLTNSPKYDELVEVYAQKMELVKGSLKEEFLDCIDYISSKRN